ncbi:MAG: ATP-dependent Clp protease proteolytic subunit, partial [Puniceicoccales bacterium]|nr:ATP-dependent Clp protease proteolytic subunit [Puniceicoccales bacterium]
MRDDWEEDEEEDDEKEDCPCEGKSCGRLSASRRIQEKFLATRKVFFWGAVNDDSAKAAVEKLLYLDLEGPGKPITFYLNTPGGCITSGMAIYDSMRMLSSPVTVVVRGMAASLGSLRLCAAVKGRRL